MNYAKIINTVVLLSALNMGAGKEVISPDGKLIATIGSDGTSVDLLNAGTGTVIKHVALNGCVESIDGLSNNKKLSATVRCVGGVDPEHMQEKVDKKTVSLGDDSCFMQ